MASGKERDLGWVARPLLHHDVDEASDPVLHEVCKRAKRAGYAAELGADRCAEASSDATLRNSTTPEFGCRMRR